MHGAKGVNAGTKLLDRFDRIQASYRKGAVGKDRKSRDTSLRPEAPNESEIEWRTKCKLQLVLR